MNIGERCMYCRCKLTRGSYFNRYRRNYIVGCFCRSQIDCFNRLVAQRDALLRTGRQMANVFFNISQRSQQLNPTDSECFARMHKEWDGAKASTGL